METVHFDKHTTAFEQFRMLYTYTSWYHLGYFAKKEIGAQG